MLGDAPKQSFRGQIRLRGNRHICQCQAGTQPCCSGQPGDREGWKTCCSYPADTTIQKRPQTAASWPAQPGPGCSCHDLTWSNCRRGFLREPVRLQVFSSVYFMNQCGRLGLSLWTPRDCWSLLCTVIIFLRNTPISGQWLAFNPNCDRAGDSPRACDQSSISAVLQLLPTVGDSS